MHAIIQRQRQRQLLPPVARVEVLYPRERMEQPRDRVRGLGERELLAGTDPRPAVEGQELPAGTQVLPALGAELLDVVAEELGAPVHHEGAVGHDVVLGDEERRLAVGTAADGENGVFVGHATVRRDGGEETEGY